MTIKLQNKLLVVSYFIDVFFYWG